MELFLSFGLVDWLVLINIVVMPCNNIGLEYIICQFVGKLFFSGEMNSPQFEDRISQAWPAKLNQTVILHQMFLALTFLMRNRSIRSVLLCCTIFYEFEQGFPSFRYVSGSGDGLGWDHVKLAFAGLTRWNMFNLLTFWPSFSSKQIDSKGPTLVNTFYKQKNKTKATQQKFFGKTS